MATINLYDIDSRFQSAVSLGATHYTVSEDQNASINVYDYFGKDDITPKNQIERNILIECIDYHLGSDQSWAMVKIVDHSYSSSDLYGQIMYMKIYDLLPIKDIDTAEVIFKIGNITNLIPEVNPNYNLGKWYKKSENEAFYNSKTQQYMVSVATNFMDMPKAQSDLYDIKKAGLIALCEYYAKEYDESSSIPSMLSYHRFVTIEKTYVPPRPNQPTRCLIAVHARYFNAIPQRKQDENMLLSALSGFDGNEVTGFRTVILNTNKLSKQIKYISRKFDSYQQKVNAFSGNVKNVNFKQEKKHLNNLFLGLKKLLSINGFNFDSNREDSIEIGVSPEDKDNVESCLVVRYVLFSQPYSYEMMAGLTAFIASESASRQNTINILINIYDVFRDMKANMDWMNFASKYFINSPIITPTKRISSASKSRDMRRNPFEIFFQKSKFFNLTPYFNADTLREIDVFINDPNVTRGLLRENRRSVEYVGDPLYNDLPNIMSDIGDLEDIFGEILFKIGLKDIVGKIIACLTKDLKISDSREVLIRGFLQSATLKKLIGILFHECVPEQIRMQIFISLFANLRLGSQQLLRLFELLEISPHHILYFKHVDPDDPNYADHANNPYELGGILTKLVTGPGGNRYIESMNKYLSYVISGNPLEHPDTDTFIKCKVKITDYLTSDAIVLILSHMVAFGVEDINDAHDFDINYDPAFTETGEVEIGMEKEEIRGKILEYLPQIISKSNIQSILNNAMTEIINISMVEVGILNESDDVYGPITSKLGVNYVSDLASLMGGEFSTETFLNLMLRCMGLEDEVSAFFGFIKNVQSKYSNVLGNFEIPDIVLGKARFDFNFNNVFLNPKFDLTAWNIDFLDDLMGDIIATVFAAIKDAIKSAILAIIESMISALDDCIAGGDESINDALYGQECIKELYEASNGTEPWEPFLDNLFTEALEKIRASECKECAPVPLEEQKAFIDIVCETLTPQELLSLMRSRNRGGISIETLQIMQSLADEISFPNVHCIMSGDILIEMFSGMGDQIDDDLMGAVENLYQLKQGVPLSACLNSSYGEETYQNPEAPLDPLCDNPANNCIQIPKRFKSVREMLQCRGLSEDEINKQISNSVNDKKEELVNMIVAANKRPEDMLNMDNACQFLPKPSQIPAMKFSSDLFFESITDSIKGTYTNDCLTYPDIMMHPDPTANEKTTTYTALKIPGGSVYGYQVVEVDGVQKLAEVIAEDENGNPEDKINPMFVQEYRTGEKIYNRIVDYYGVETITEIKKIDGENIYELIERTLREDKIHDPNDGTNSLNVLPNTYDLLIKRQQEVKRVAPILENALEDIFLQITAAWNRDPLTNSSAAASDHPYHGTYTITIGDDLGQPLVKGVLGTNENSLILPVDLTSGRPDCEEFGKLEMPAFCAIEDRPSVMISESGDYRYDKNTATYVKTKMLNDDIIIPQAPNPFIMDFIDDVEFKDGETWEDLSAALLDTSADTIVGDRDINYFHNMVRSFINFFAGAIENSELFDPKKMQTFRIEPRTSNVNSTSVEKNVKSLLDFDEALKRAQEFFEENCSFGNIGPEDKTVLQQAGIYAIIVLTIRIYIVDILMRGSFLLTTVLKEEIGDAFFTILFDNFKQDLKEFSPEYYIEFMSAMEEIYKVEKTNNIEMPEIKEEEQILKYFMKNELKLMNITLQEIFKKAYSSVKRAFLAKSHVFDVQRLTNVVYWYNRDIEFGSVEATDAIQTTYAGVTELQDFLLNNDLEDLTNIESSFFLKRYFINSNNINKRVDWSRTDYNEDNDVGVELCYFDVDKNEIAHNSIFTTGGQSNSDFEVVYGGINTKVVRQIMPDNSNNYFFSVYKSEQLYTPLMDKMKVMLKLVYENEPGSIRYNTLHDANGDTLPRDESMPYFEHYGYMEHHLPFESNNGEHSVTLTVHNITGDDNDTVEIKWDPYSPVPSDSSYALWSMYEQPFDLFYQEVPWFKAEADRLRDEAIQENYENIGSNLYIDELGDTQVFSLSHFEMAQNYMGSFVILPVAKCETGWDLPTSFDTLEQEDWPILLEILKQGISVDQGLSQADKDAGLGFVNFFTDCIPAEVLYDLLFSYVVAMTSRYVPNIENVFYSTKDNLKSSFNSLNVPFGDFEYMDGDIKEKGGPSGMYQTAYTNSGTSPDFSATAAKFAAMTPFMIIKGLAEQFDPNIKIAKYIRLGALSAGIDLPMGLASLVVAVPPFFGPGIIPGPLGLIYLATDFLEPKERERLAEISDGVNSSVPGEEGYEVVPPVEDDITDLWNITISEEAKLLANFERIMTEVWEYLSDAFGDIAFAENSSATYISVPTNFGGNVKDFMSPNHTFQKSALYWMKKLTYAFDCHDCNTQSDQIDNDVEWVLLDASEKNQVMAMTFIWVCYHSAWNFFWRFAYLWPLNLMSNGSHWDYTLNELVYDNTIYDSGTWFFNNHDPSQYNYSFGYTVSPKDILQETFLLPVDESAELAVDRSKTKFFIKYIVMKAIEKWPNNMNEDYQNLAQDLHMVVSASDMASIMSEQLFGFVGWYDTDSVKKINSMLETDLLLDSSTADTATINILKKHVDERTTNTKNFPPDFGFVYPIPDELAFQDLLAPGETEYNLVQEAYDLFDPDETYEYNPFS